MCEITKLAPSKSALKVTFGNIKDAPDVMVCNKACAFVGDGGVWINQEWWSAQTCPQRDYTIAHEMAHALDGIVSENCADRRAGAILRQWGYTRGLVVKSARETIEGRPLAWKHAGDGWDIMNNFLNGRAFQ